MRLPSAASCTQHWAASGAGHSCFEQAYLHVAQLAVQPSASPCQARCKSLCFHWPQLPDAILILNAMSCSSLPACDQQQPWLLLQHPQAQVELCTLVMWPSSSRTWSATVRGVSTAAKVEEVVESRRSIPESSLRLQDNAGPL